MESLFFLMRHVSRPKIERSLLCWYIVKVKASGMHKLISILFTFPTFYSSLFTLHVYMYFLGNNPSLMTCQVIDSTQRLKSEDWARVIAVFAQGAVWQFKGWKYDKPVELFTHVKGFHLKCEDETVGNPTIKSWNVTTLTVHRTKRYLDIEAVTNFWTKLEAWLSSHPHFDFRPEDSLRKEKPAVEMKRPSAQSKSRV